MAALACALWLAWVLAVPTTPPEPKELMFPTGSSTNSIAEKLESAGVIRSRVAFRLLHYTQPRRQLKAGEYKFRDSANAIQVFNRMVRGDVVIHTVVIPEGYNVFEIAEAVEDAGLGKKEEFLKIALHDTALVNSFAPHAKSLEGYLYPDTYHFTRSMTMEEIATAMVRRFQRESVRLDLGPDLHQLVTLASIVEKETANPDERRVIAGVYTNRLKRGMALDADPTVAYAAMLKGKYKGTIYEHDLQANSPYNTYKNPGLPPGPIANPGEAALLAAQNPDSNRYLYFVAIGDGSGRHHFSATLDEHTRNVAAYRRRMRRR
jgi:UPF0755 protein